MDRTDVDVKVWSWFMWLRILRSSRACVNLTMHILVP